MLPPPRGGITDLQFTLFLPVFGACSAPRAFELIGTKRTVWSVPSQAVRAYKQLRGPISIFLYPLSSLHFPIELNGEMLNWPK